jgi:hypothetical protein
MSARVRPQRRHTMALGLADLIEGEYPRAQFLTDTLTTAIEGGIGYWATTDVYHWSEQYPPEVRGATIIDCERVATAVPSPDVWTVVNLYSLEEAINRLIDFREEVACHDDFRLEIFRAALAGEADFDAGVADIIFQVAALGDVIYG